jgi:hypothetical protein
MLKQMVGTKLDVTKLQAPITSAAMPPLPQGFVKVACAV